MEAINKQLIEMTGESVYERSVKEMEEYWEEPVDNLRTYFEMLDAKVAELKHMGGGADMANY